MNQIFEYEMKEEEIKGSWIDYIRELIIGLNDVLNISRDSYDKNNDRVSFKHSTQALVTPIF